MWYKDLYARDVFINFFLNCSNCLLMLLVTLMTESFNFSGIVIGCCCCRLSSVLVFIYCFFNGQSSNIERSLEGLHVSDVLMYTDKHTH